MKIEARKIFGSNGLIDDLVVSGNSEEYLEFSKIIGETISSNTPESMRLDSDISIEIIRDDEEEELFTSLQNKTNEYYSMNDWNNRDVLRIFGSDNVLSLLQSFLSDLSGRGEGYSYISEYSEKLEYSRDSPEWRLHVEPT